MPASYKFKSNNLFCFTLIKPFDLERDLGVLEKIENQNV
jgi:hypothetical protein